VHFAIKPRGAPFQVHTLTPKYFSPQAGGFTLQGSPGRLEVRGSACSCGAVEPLLASGRYGRLAKRGDDSKLPEAFFKFPNNLRGEARMAVEEKVKQIIVEQLQVDESEVTPNASFQEDLGADSSSW
jgi:hypothetical protein